MDIRYFQLLTKYFLLFLTRKKNNIQVFVFSLDLANTSVEDWQGDENNPLRYTTKLNKLSNDVPHFIMGNCFLNCLKFSYVQEILFFKYHRISLVTIFIGYSYQRLKNREKPILKRIFDGDMRSFSFRNLYSNEFMSVLISISAISQALRAFLCNSL